MDLADFQLDIDMLRSMTTNQQQQQQQQQQTSQQQQSQPNGVFERMDMLFQEGHNQELNFMNTTYPSTSKPLGNQKATPAYHNHHHNDYFDQDDILTPLISPAITPSFSYHQELHNGTIVNDVDFSPLSSPAMMPQRDQDYMNHRQQQYQPHHHTNLQQSYQNTSNSTTIDYPQMSSNQICKQYEQLEKAKMMITRRLTELQKHQKSQDTPSTYMNNTSEGTMTNPVSRSSGVFRQPGQLEPVTPASLMNIRQRQTNTTREKQSGTFPPVSAKAALNEMDISDNLDKIPPSYATSTATATTTTTTTTITTPSLVATTSSSSSSSSASSVSSIATPPKSKRKAKQAVDTRNTRKTRRSSSYNSSETNTTHHASPRALKPLLISPSLTPDQNHHHHHHHHHNHHLAPHLNQVSTVQDAEHILATRSNYQNLMEGKAAALGIAFSSQIKSGLEVRRTAHKAAEQKRRDSLKEWFDRLRREVEEGYVKKKSGLTSKVIREQQREKGDADQDEDAALKPLSKVLLLRYAYEYIAHLKDTLAERDELLRTLGQQDEDEEDDDE